MNELCTQHAYRLCKYMYHTCSCTVFTPTFLNKPGMNPWTFEERGARSRQFVETRTRCDTVLQAPPNAVSSSTLLRSSLELSDTQVYELWIWALLGTASHFCEVFALKSPETPFCTKFIRNCAQDETLDCSHFRWRRWLSWNFMDAHRSTKCWW